MTLFFRFMVACTMLMIFAYETTSGQENENWDFMKEKNGVKIWTRKTDDSPMKEVKVESVIHASLSSLVALMKDAPNHKNWVYANEEAKFLAEYSNFSWVFYGHSDAPWPVQDRDMVVNATLTQDSATGVVKNEGICAPDFIPKNEDIVRIRDCRSLWTLIPQDSGDVLVRLEMRVDLGGSIPSWLMNMVVAKGPYSTIRNMEEEVKLPRYRDADLDYIID